MNYGEINLSEEEGMRYGPPMPQDPIVVYAPMPKEVWWKKFLNWVVVVATLLGAAVALLWAYGCGPVKPPQPPKPPVEVPSPVCTTQAYGCWVQPPGQKWQYSCAVFDVNGGVVGTQLVADPKECPLKPEKPPKPVVEEFCTKGRKVARWHPYLQGIDITWVCQGDHDFCDSIGYGEWNPGEPRYDCPFGPDMSEIRHLREQTLGCPAVYWSYDKTTEFKRCYSKPNLGGMSCDHWDLHNVPPYGCEVDTGFFSIPQGKGFLKICSLVDSNVCSPIAYYEQQ